MYLWIWTYFLAQQLIKYTVLYTVHTVIGTLKNALFLAKPCSGERTCHVCIEEKMLYTVECSSHRIIDDRMEKHDSLFVLISKYSIAAPHWRIFWQKNFCFCNFAKFLWNLILCFAKFSSNFAKLKIILSKFSKTLN